MFSREDRENGQIGNIADGDKDLITKNAFNKCLSRQGLPGRSVPAVQESISYPLLDQTLSGFSLASKPKPTQKKMDRAPLISFS